ncbi:MAG: ribonuclease P protein component [Elusimicrobia bacterium]|nr:ribonuclease P protein component [Elusimicrobiota bacterium]
MALSRKNRLTRKDNFLRIKKYGKRVVSNGLICYIYPNNSKVSRLAVVASSKSGIACNRNRLKRCIREEFRLNMQHFTRNADVIVFAQKDAVSLISHTKVRKYFLNVLKESKILN